VIPFLDLGAAYSELQSEIDDGVGRVLHSGQYILGPEVDAFESEFASFTGADHCVGVASGFDALFLALVALGIGPGDEVIVPSNTYIATWLAVTKTGARLVPVEPDEDTMNISLPGVAEAMTSATKAVLPVHLYGLPVDIEPLVAFCRSRGVWVIEDAAQAHGGVVGEQRIGSHSDAVAWSFYPSKNLGALGDAGAVTTSSADVALRIRELGNYGSPEKNVHAIQGFNSRLDPIQAAILRAKLRHLVEWNTRRRDRAAQYLEALNSSDLVLPSWPDGFTPVWHLFVVRHEKRDALRSLLADAGVITQIHYPTPPHLQAAYRDLGWVRGSFPVSEAIHETVLSLPIGPHMSEQDQRTVIGAVTSALTVLSAS
jgi:dTDP-4-amino-4,6-dideoxygalactose transaminase